MERVAILFRGEPVFKRIVRVNRASRTQYLTRSVEEIAYIVNYHGDPGGKYWRGWTVLDAENRVLDGPFDTKRQAEEYLALEIATRP